MILKKIIFFLVCILLYQTQLYSKSNSFGDFNSKNLAKYFSGIIALEKSLQLTPNDTDLRITKNLMSAYLLAERFEEAVNLGEVSMQRKNSMVYILLAYAEAIIGDGEKAKQYIYQQLDFSNAVRRDSFYQQMAAINEKEFGYCRK